MKASTRRVALDPVRTSAYARTVEPVIRVATDVDAHDILVCLATAFAPYQADYTTEAWLDTVLTPSTVRRRIAEMHVLVADAGGERVVGTLACHPTASGHGHLRGMAVRPAWAGSGVAPLLLRAAEAHLAERGCSIVSLDTTAPLRRAVAFYEKHGYRRTGRVTDFFGMPLYEFEKRGFDIRPGDAPVRDE